MKLYQPNPLQYPAGFMPGYDPSHVAAQDLPRGTFVAVNGNFVDIGTGKVGTTSGSPTRAIQAILGDCVKFVAASSQFVTFAAGTYKSEVPTRITMAAIFSLNSFNGAGHCVIIGNATTAGGAGYQMWVSNTGGLTLDLPGVGSQASGLTIATATPYFVAFTYNQANNGVAYWAVTNLKTGQVTTATNTAVGLDANSGDGGFAIGNDPHNVTIFADGFIAAAMCSTSIGSEGTQTPMQITAAQALRIWADNPWSYWYPILGDSEQDEDVVGVAAVVAALVNSVNRRFSVRRPLR